MPAVRVRSASRPIAWTIAALVGVIGLRAVLSLRGYLYLDDFAFRYWAATSELDADYLLRSYGGHVNPVGLFVQWCLQHAMPGSYLALAVFSLLMYALSLVLFAAILWRVTQRQAAVAVGVVLAGLSLFGFEVTVWWSAAIYSAPYQLFLLACTYAAIRGICDASRTWLFASAGAGIAVVLSYSRGSAGLLLVFLLVASLPLVSGSPLGVREAFERARWFWGILAAIAVAGGALVLSVGGPDAPGQRSLLDAAHYMWTLLVLNVLPAVWGGPWRWFELPNQQWDPILANPAPMWWAVWLAAVVTIVALVWIWRRRPSLRLLLVSVGVYTLGVLALAAYARAGSPVESVAYRYTFDLVWPITLLMVLAVVPPMGDDRRVSRPGVAVVAAVAVMALWSTVVPATDWASNPSKDYMARAVAGFDSIPEGTVLDQGVPFDLIHPVLMAPYANAMTVFTPQPGAPLFVDHVNDSMYGFGADGSVEQQSVDGLPAPAGPDPDCGYRVSDLPRTIPLGGDLIAWPFYARIAYFTGTETQLNVAIGGRIHSVPLQTGGVRAVYFPVTGPASDIFVSTGSPGVVACLTEVRVGNRVSPDGQRVPLAPGAGIAP